MGGAGRFLTSCLMASSSVAHFDRGIEQNKTEELCLDYVKHKFTNSLDWWLKTEPNAIDAWNLSFISSKYPRGDNLSLDEFVANTKEQCTDYFWESIDSNKLIGINYHKTTNPVYFQQAKNIVVIVDPASVKWLHRANWYKHYAVTDQGIHIKINDPVYFNSVMGRYFSQFNNPIYSDEHFYSFVKKNIINCKFKDAFLVKENFEHLPNVEFINLSDILDKERFVENVQQIAKKLELQPISASFLESAHQHWDQCHNFKYARTNSH